MQAAEANERLRRLMEGLEPRHTLSMDSEGYAVARFLHAMPDGWPITMEATVRVEELLLTAYEALPSTDSEQELSWALEVNDQWCLGQLYLGASGTRFDAAASLYLGGNPDGDAVESLTRQLLMGVASMRRGQVPTYHPPPRHPPLIIEEIEVLLASVGVKSHPSRSGGLAAGFKRESVPISLAFYLFDGAMLNLRAHLHPRFEVRSREEGLRAVHAYNRQLTYGAVSLHEGRWPSYYMPISSQWCPIDETTLRWAVDKALRIALDMHRTLPLVERTTE